MTVRRQTQLQSTKNKSVLSHGMLLGGVSAALVTLIGASQGAPDLSAFRSLPARAWHAAADELHTLRTEAWATATPQQKLDGFQRGGVELLCGTITFQKHDLPTRDAVARVMRRDPSCQLQLTTH